MANKLANLLLGYPKDARLLILNADDFGFCHAINQAIIGCLEAGLIRSTTVMAPCPWASEALQFLAGRPEIPFGIHLTLISDPAGYRWGPLLGREKAPSLVDEFGYFYRFDDMPVLRQRATLCEIEAEFRLQIDTVFMAGLHPTHLDWHALRFAERLDILDLMIDLAKEYGLAMRVFEPDRIDRLQGEGLPTMDGGFVDSYALSSETKPEEYSRMLRELPEGLSDWAIHPGMDAAELRAIEPNTFRNRTTDFAFWTSLDTKTMIEREGIILLDYRPLQARWIEYGRGSDQR